MAYTLSQLSKIETEPLRKGIIMNILRYAKLMEWLPFENVGALRSVAVRWTELPDVSFRGINMGYTGSEGQYEQVYESVYGFGGEIEFDRVFEKIQNTIVDPKTDQVNQKMKALGFTFNDYFINGDHATDPDAFEGLKKRVSLLPSRQTVGFAGASSAALDPTASTANARTFVDTFEKAMYRTNSGQVNAILCNEGIKWGLGKVLRYVGVSGGNWLDMTKDSFDREYPTYKGVPLIDVGLKKDQVTEIITETEVAGDAGADATSIYFVSFGIEDGLTGIQLAPLEVYDPLNGGERESKPTKLTRIDWWIGMAGFGSYGLTRAWNVEGAANWT